MVYPAGAGDRAGVGVVMVEHKSGCAWEPERKHCTCGALVLTMAYRFANGNIIAFDQFGNQMPQYQGRDAAECIARDWPAIEIRAGEMV